jgi:hypothetical protein
VRAPGQEEAEDVAEVVAGVGEEGERAREDTERGLGDHVGEVEADAEGEGAVVAGRGVGMRVRMSHEKREE